MATQGQDIAFAKELLKKGELIAIPTETVYGLAANALDATAVAKIFIVKERPAFDPLIIHVGPDADLTHYVSSVPETAKKLMKRFWPGPLTLVLPKKKIIPDLVTAGLDTVGVRCPDHFLTQQLLREIDFPLAAPSANPFGYISPTTAAHVDAQLGEKIPYILDGGPCRVGLESTIVGFEENEVVIYRRGGISEEAIEKLIGKVTSKLHGGSNPNAPGQLDSHYSPTKFFEVGEIGPLQEKHKGKKIGVLRFKKHNEANEEFHLSETGDLAEAAKNLFAMLRRLDQLEFDIIIAETVPNIGIGKAINDRLVRAATK